MEFLDKSKNKMRRRMAIICFINNWKIVLNTRINNKYLIFVKYLLYVSEV